MSTLKTVNIQHPSASSPAIVLDSAGAMIGSFPSSNRNLLYNGAMQIHQRSTGVAGITGSSFNTADRFGLIFNNLGTFTQTIENDAPTGSGFRKSLKMLCTTAKNPTDEGSYCKISQPLEGFDVQRIAKGSASAQKLTLSFCVKSNVTGNYIAELFDHTNNRQISAIYQISQIDTWQKKTITFLEDTTGTLNNDNQLAFRVNWWIGGGSLFTSGTLNTSWANLIQANRAVGQVNVAASAYNYWQITGTQLEVGSVATPFEFKSYGQELQQCQRYYYEISSGNNFFMGTWLNTTAATISSRHPVIMRAAPSINTPTDITVEQSGIAFRAGTEITPAISSDAIRLTVTGATGSTQYAQAFWAGSIIKLNAEL